MTGFIDWVHSNSLVIYFNDHPMPQAPQVRRLKNFVLA